MISFYFGCGDDEGHFFWLPGSNGLRCPPRDRRAEKVVPWGYGVERLAYERHGEQIEGHALLHHKDGWTALAFPDRSVDDRLGSKSVFVFDAELDFDQALAAAREQFPQVFARFSFDVIPSLSLSKRR